MLGKSQKIAEVLDRSYEKPNNYALQNLNKKLGKGRNESPHNISGITTMATENDKTRKYNTKSMGRLKEK